MLPTHAKQDAIVADATGGIKLTLWNDDINTLEDDHIVITNRILKFVHLITNNICVQPEMVSKSVKLTTLKVFQQISPIWIMAK